MEKEKIVKLSRILLFALILVFIFAFFIWPKLNDDDMVIGNDGEGISTDITFNVADYDSGKMVQDYSNPTDEERAAINKKYGIGYNYFDEEGLHLVNVGDIYTYEEDRLITDKWPKKNELTDSILRPDMEIREIEIAETYLVINVKDVTKKDMENYIEEIEKEYKHEISGVHPNTLYRAYDDKERLIDIRWVDNQGTIKYRFE